MNKRTNEQANEQTKDFPKPKNLDGVGQKDDLILQFQFVAFFGFLQFEKIGNLALERRVFPFQRPQLDLRAFVGS